MDTITVRQAHGDTLEIPVAVAFGADGKPTDLIGDVEPEHCNHQGRHGQLVSTCGASGAGPGFSCRGASWRTGRRRQSRPCTCCGLRPAGRNSAAGSGAPYPASGPSSTCQHSPTWRVPVRHDRLATFQAVTP